MPLKSSRPTLNCISKKFLRKKNDESDYEIDDNDDDDGDDSDVDDDDGDYAGNDDDEDVKGM